jgi:ribosomal protein S18 acetylase RimI-like enzyme
MAEAEAIRHVRYRCLQPSDAAALKRLHDVIFPIDYDQQFFDCATHAKGIIGWAAVLPAHHYQATFPDETTVFTGGEQLVGFITARDFVGQEQIPSADWQYLSLDHGVRSTMTSQAKATYILTLGVAKTFRQHGVAMALLRLLERHAQLEGCVAMYLHVINYNMAAMNFYTKAGFTKAITLRNFYHIGTGRALYPDVKDYDASLFFKHVLSQEAPGHLVEIKGCDETFLAPVYYTPYLANLLNYFWQAICHCIPLNRLGRVEDSYKRDDGDNVRMSAPVWLKNLFGAPRSVRGE